MYICEYCKKEFKKQQSLAAHKRHCKLNPNFDEEKYRKILSESAKKGYTTFKQNNKEIFEKHTYKCICQKCGKEYNVELTEQQYNKKQFSKFCSKSCSNSHVVSNQTKQKISQSLKCSEKFKINNKKANLARLETRIKNDTTNTLEIINGKLIRHFKCKECGKDFTKLTERNIGGRTYCSAECKHKYLSEHTGGYRNGSGRGKSGWYKGIYCDSSWELAFVIYHLDHDLFIQRCSKTRSYIYNGKEHTYHPDFTTKKGIVEIKGWKTEQWEEKQKANSDIIVLYKNDMQLYLDYAIQTYGANFIEMYDDSKPVKENKKLYCVNKDGKNIMIPKDKLQDYIKNGWARGRVK